MQPVARTQYLAKFYLQSTAVRYAEGLPYTVTCTAEGKDATQMCRPDGMDGRQSMTCGAPMATAVRTRMLSKPAW